MVRYKCVLAICSPTTHPFHFLVWEVEVISPVSSVACGNLLSILRKKPKNEGVRSLRRSKINLSLASYSARLCIEEGLLISLKEQTELCFV